MWDKIIRHCVKCKDLTMGRIASKVSRQGLWLTAVGHLSYHCARCRVRQAKIGWKAGLFDHLLVNDDLETCYVNLKKLLTLDDGREDSDDFSSYSIVSKNVSEILLQPETEDIITGSVSLKRFSK
ncbi:unnamed protein product [Urochloa humidicola]